MRSTRSGTFWFVSGVLSIDCTRWNYYISDKPIMCDLYYFFAFTKKYERICGYIRHVEKKNMQETIGPFDSLPKAGNLCVFRLNMGCGCGGSSQRRPQIVGNQTKAFQSAQNSQARDKTQEVGKNKNRIAELIANARKLDTPTLQTTAQTSPPVIRG